MMRVIMPIIFEWDRMVISVCWIGKSKMHENIDEKPTFGDSSSRESPMGVQFKSAKKNQFIFGY